MESDIFPFAYDKEKLTLIRTVGYPSSKILFRFDRFGFFFRSLGWQFGIVIKMHSPKKSRETKRIWKTSLVNIVKWSESDGYGLPQDGTARNHLNLSVESRFRVIFLVRFFLGFQFLRFVSRTLGMPNDRNSKPKNYIMDRK